MSNNILTIVRKEVYDYVSNRTFLVIMAIFSLLILVSAYQGVLTYDEQLQNYEQMVEYADQLDLQRPGAAKAILDMPQPNVLDSYSSMATFIGLVGGILALALGFDAVSGEREKRSLNVLMTMPVFRDVVINSKIISRLIVITLALGISFLLGSVLIVGLTGFSPSGGDLARLAVLLLLCVAYVALFLGLGVLLSIKLKESSSALLWGVIIWLILTILVPPMAALVADAATPGTGWGRAKLAGLSPEQEKQALQQLDEEKQQRLSIENAIRLLSPVTHFERAANAVLTKTTGTDLGGGESRSFSLGEALASSWQYILTLMVIVALLFGSCYMLFTRMDLT
jgi:ABC-2 type transport system permease protein